MGKHEVKINEKMGQGFGKWGRGDFVEDEGGVQGSMSWHGVILCVGRDNLRF